MEKLNLVEMSEIAGGKVCTKAEYCHTLEVIFEGAWNRPSDQIKIADAYASNCAH